MGRAVGNTLVYTYYITHIYIAYTYIYIQYDLVRYICKNIPYRFAVALVYERWQSQVFEVRAVGNALEAALPLTTALPTMPDTEHTQREGQKKEG